MEKKYWFYIDTYVHFFLKNDSILFYNSYTGKILEYKGNKDIIRLVKRLLSPRNLQVILLKETDIAQPTLSGFISDIRENFMGDLLDVSYSNGKPILMPPLVKNQRDVTLLKKEKDRSVGEDILSYLTEISLYINETCSQSCSLCKKAYKQFLCCTSSQNGKNQLKPDQIGSLFSSVNHSRLARVNILGGDFLTYPYLNDLMSIIKPINCEKNYYLHYLNLPAHKTLLRSLVGGDSLLVIIVSFPFSEERLDEALFSVKDLELRKKLMFIIEDKNTFELAESIASKYVIEDALYIPFFNGNNFSFFRQILFITREDIKNDRVSSREIYARGFINPLYFGRISVSPRGQVYSNVNDTALGEIGTDSMYKLLSKELVGGKSWRKIRRKVQPCKSCVFVDICPPISNYNRIIKRYNLCNIWMPPEQICADHLKLVAF